MDRLTEIINEWDPIDLMSHAPDDEYELEIKMIRNIINDISNEFEVAQIIYDIFLETCGKELFKKSVEDCAIIAKKIMALEK
ncbi:hypothetical protein AXX12_13855 [Anaerosporomusa subterranea]|uniref:DUF1871 domain-containing protein n=1 Tax=Anaerosporomusa subterranea TaxID=1794912 RepID=A0A154BMN2_ANASB|nr:DUF1871 family protein [Anaerosporomusa subterranea]KYZ75243.1 hypothetical protein AXX12_13855 [Anaerosporomusa subterranea]